MTLNVSEEITFTDTTDQTIDSLQTNSWALKLKVTKQKDITVQPNSFQKPISQSVSIFFKFCPSVASFVFIVTQFRFGNTSKTY